MINQPKTIATISETNWNPRGTVSFGQSGWVPTAGAEVLEATSLVGIGTLYLDLSNDALKAADTLSSTTTITYQNLARYQYARIRFISSTPTPSINATLTQSEAIYGSQINGNVNTQTLNANALSAKIFNGSIYNVIEYGAVDGQDSTAAIQAAINACNGLGVVFIPSDVNLIVSTSLIGLTSGSFYMSPGSKLTGATTFAGSGKRGIIELTNTSNLIIDNLNIDLTSTTDGNVCSIHQSNGAVLDTKILNTTQDLGGASQHFGILLEGLGATSTPSRDLLIENVSTHNGNGDVQCYANAAQNGLAYSQVTISNCTSLLDENGIGDDRVLVAANTPNSTYQGEVRDILVSNTKIQIASMVTSGLINGVKFDAGANSYLHDWTIDGIYYQNESSTSLGSPFNVYTGSASYQENISINNVYANTCNSSLVEWARLNPDPSFWFSKIRIIDCLSTIAAIEVEASTNPAGDEVFVFENCIIKGSLAGSSYTSYGPLAIMLSGSTSAGGSGNITIKDCFVDGFNTPFSSIVNNSGNEQASGWSNIQLYNNKWINCSKPPLFSNAYKLSNNPGYNPIAPATLTIVSGTIYQNTTGSTQKITASVNSTAAGTAQWALGSSSTPPAWGGATTTLASGDQEKNLTVPPGWYYSLTVTGTATITAQAYGE